MAFWQVAFILTLLAIGFVLWPLLKFKRKSWAGPEGYDETQADLYAEHLADLEKARLAGDIDTAQFDELKLELRKTLANEIGMVQPVKQKVGGKQLVIAVAVLTPLVAVFLYNSGGAKADWHIYEVLQELPEASTQEDYNRRMRELVVKVQARLQQTPDNLQLRNLLAQTSMALQDFDMTVDAYKKILEQVPNSPRVISNLAQALFYRAGNVVTPEVREYTQQALTLAPMLPEMLGLAGIDAKNQGDLTGAIRYWKMAVSQMDPNSRVAQGYLNGIANAERALASAGQSADQPAASPGPGAPQGQQAGDADAAGSSITVQVALADSVKVGPEVTVFVYARAWQGPRMPLAIQRITVADLPTEIVLDAGSAMAPGMTIDSFPQLEILARVSRSGDPSPKSGDWQAAKGPITAAEQDGPVQLLIDSQIP